MQQSTTHKELNQFKDRVRKEKLAKQVCFGENVGYSSFHWRLQLFGDLSKARRVLEELDLRHSNDLSMDHWGPAQKRQRVLEPLTDEEQEQVTHLLDSMKSLGQAEELVTEDSDMRLVGKHTTCAF